MSRFDACRCLRVKLNRLNDLIEIIVDLNRPIRKRGSFDPALRQDLIKHILVTTVICNGCIRIFELMPGQNANYAI